MKYFEPQGLGASIFQDRYVEHEGETYTEASRRIADFIAKAEKPEIQEQVADMFFEELTTNRLMGGGRIMYGAGRPKAQLLNCFVVPTEDSIEGWGRAVSDVMVISGKLGGVGLNFSPIRPRRSYIKGNGGTATGAVSLMKIVNAPGSEIVAGGGRRMALMFCLNLTHPDILEFLDAKLNQNELNNANISVVIDIPTDEFVTKVKNNELLELKFEGAVDKDGNAIGQSIPAREVWNKIVQNAWINGEPGVLNGHYANEMNNIWYYSDLISTNPCGEIWLEPYGCCDLASLVLPRFVVDGEVDWDQLADTVEIGVRFLDNVLDVNQYPLPEIEKNCQNVRRLGLGVMGLHSMLLELGIKYSSDEAIWFIDLLFDFIKSIAYNASIELAKEKGAFPAYDERFLEGKFIQSLHPILQEKIAKYGIRNCALLTIAPTGTTSMVPDVSSGIEPIPAPVYWRTRFINSDDGVPSRSVDLVVRDEVNLYPGIVEGAADIPVEAHFKIQATVQKHIDNAVSKTINLPKDYPMEDLADIWLEYLPYMKGSTFYRWGSREYEPISPVPVEQWNDVIADDYAKKALASLTIDSSDVEALLGLDCPGGVCEVPYSVVAPAV